jgi:hypothetical protein
VPAVAATAGSTGILLAGSASSRTGHFGFAVLESPLRILYWSLCILSGVRVGSLVDGAVRRHIVMIFGYCVGKMITMSRQYAVYAKTVVARPLMENM